MKETKQIINSNFTLLVLELEEAIKSGYSLVSEGESRPYHAIMGNFILTLEKECEEEEQHDGSVGEIQGELVLEAGVVEEVVQVAVKTTKTPTTKTK
jgi:hypothetical protein